MMKTSRGLTLIELLVVLAVMAILLTVAVPGYQSITASYAVSSETNALMGDLEYARNEAVRQGLNVVVCASSNGSTCNASATFSSGWIVAVPGNGGCTTVQGAAGQSNQVLRAQSAFSSGDAASYSNTSNPGVCYTRLGIAASSYTGKFTLAAPSGSRNPSGSNQACLVIPTAGNPHMLSSGKSDALGSC